MIKRCSVLFSILLVVAVPASSQPSEAISVTDLLKIKQISQLNYAPDGKQIAFTVTEITERSDTPGSYAYLTHIWLVPADGSREPRALTTGSTGASQPAWHPSGNSLTFVRSVNGRNQLFLLSFEGGEPVQLTNHPAGASGPRWSPDGSTLLFTASVTQTNLLKDSLFASGPPWDAERPERSVGDIPLETRPNPDGSLAEIRAWLDQNATDSNPRVINRLNFLAETDLNPVMSYSHVYTLPFDAGSLPEEPQTAAALTSGYFSFNGAQWSSDGKRIFLSADLDSTTHPDRTFNNDIYVMQADGSNLRRLIGSSGFSYTNPQPSPDGRYILFQGSDLNDRGYGQTRLFMADLNTLEVVHLSEGFDRSVGSPSWSSDSRYVYFTANSNGGTPLYRVDIRKRRVSQLSPYEKGIRNYALAKNTVVFVQTEVANPYEIYTARADASQPKRISRFNHDWISAKTLSYPDRFTLTRPDGFEIEYWVMKPTFLEAGKTYPLLLQIHGGPSAMWGPGEASMWLEFQFFAARGYGIVYANPRGSGGYGRAFQAGNFQNWGTGPADDVLAAASEAVTMPWADSTRQVVTGGSYAGYLTAWIVAHDHRFKAAFAQRGVYHLETFLGEGNAWRLVPNHFGGYPWEEGIDEILKRESPQTYVHQIHTPLLIKHGDVDLRTGVIQSEMLYKALKIQGKEVEYVRYPRASHEMSRSGEPLQRMDRILRIYEFFQRYVGDERGDR